MISFILSSAGIPILPSKWVLNPAARRISAIKLETVPLPFEPVTPIIGAGQFSKNKFVTDVTLTFFGNREGLTAGVRTIKSA